MKKGLLIAIEGIDGSGKTTQVKLLTEYFKENNIPFEVISFPRYEDNVYGKLVYRYLNGEFGKLFQINPYLISLIFAGDRCLAKTIIENWLAQGKIVIANRYISSSKAHLGANLPADQRAEFIKWLDQLEYQTNRMPKEDLTILLSVTPEAAQKNVTGGDADLHEDNFQHLEGANQQYLDLAKNNSNWYVVDCMKNGSMKKPLEINQDVIQILEKNI